MTITIPPLGGRGHLLIWAGLGVGAYGILSGRGGLALLGFGALAYAAFHGKTQQAQIIVTPAPAPAVAPGEALPAAFPILRQ